MEKEDREQAADCKARRLEESSAQMVPEELKHTGRNGELKDVAAIRGTEKMYAREDTCCRTSGEG